MAADIEDMVINDVEATIRQRKALWGQVLQLKDYIT